MYADYTFYTTQYLGSSIAEADFNRLATRASEIIDDLTHGRAAAYVQDHPDDNKVKMACCALAENYRAIENARVSAASGELQSESVGAYSRSYRSGAEIMMSVEADNRKILRRYLGSTGLLYGGVGCVCTAHCHSL